MVPHAMRYLGLLLLCSTYVLASNSSTSQKSQVDLPIEPLAHLISALSGHNHRCIKVLFGNVPPMQNHFGSMQQMTVADKLWPAQAWQLAIWLRREAHCAMAVIDGNADFDVLDQAVKMIKVVQTHVMVLLLTQDTGLPMMPAMLEQNVLWAKSFERARLYIIYNLLR